MVDIEVARIDDCGSSQNKNKSIYNMKSILFLILVVPNMFLGATAQDTINKQVMFKLLKLETQKRVSDSLIKEVKNLSSRFEYEQRSNERALNDISNQIGAASFNLTHFGILFSVFALGLGVYMTYLERKTVSIREETKDLLKQTIVTKEQVENINKLIQNDIYGLFIKIKREETIHILKRLQNVPEDISNLSNALLSRELEKEDFYILKDAYLKLSTEPGLASGALRLGMNFKDSYHLLFFQHFLDLSISDEIIGPNLISFYETAINCAFENDITKSTEDFTKGIIDVGYQRCDKEINSFIKGISKSVYKDFDKVYEIIFNALKSRDDRFKFFELIRNEGEWSYGKYKFGQLLKTYYNDQNQTNSEKGSFEQLERIAKEITGEKNVLVI